MSRSSTGPRYSKAIMVGLKRFQTSGPWGVSWRLRASVLSGMIPDELMVGKHR